MAKGINIFDSAKGKPKPSSSAKDKPTVEVDGIEGQLNELQNLKTQIANLETQLDVVTDEIKTIAKEKFVELYLEKGRNPNTFLLKDGTGCVMVIPTDKYISIKDEDRANELIENYGEEIVTIDEKYYFNPEVLERNMKAIEKLIRDAKGISDADKQNLLVREVKYSITKGTIDELADYGEDMESVINDIQPIITLKNCGGKMAEGGTDGEFIANIYENGGMMAKGGKVELIVHGKSRQYSLGKFNSAKEAKKYVEESDLKQPYSIKKLEDGGVMMAHGGMSEYFSKQASMKGGIAYYSVDIDTKSRDEIRDLEFKSYSEARKVFEKYKKSMKYNGDDIEDIQLICNYKNGDYDKLDFKINSKYNSDLGYLLDEQMASGGLFGSSRYNEGLSWHLDHARHNKKESYEKPLNKRKRRFKK